MNLLNSLFGRSMCCKKSREVRMRYVDAGGRESCCDSYVKCRCIDCCGCPCNYRLSHNCHDEHFRTCFD
ncbi:MAG: hypothetical protein E7473_09190 [Ruminococcaceae bacterium]|nr:hypothetical protein [Oscillospiraceae bacterium]